MIKDVVNQLRRISSQQTHIQGMRNRMGAFREAALKEAQMMKQLYTARQTSAAYRQCLAECMRRQVTPTPSRVSCRRETVLAEHVHKNCGCRRSPIELVHDVIRAEVDLADNPPQVPVIQEGVC